ncbi:MAG: thioredoxin family protein [Bacteriovoracaceae bacterium]
MKILAAILFSLASLSSFAIPNGSAPAFELKAASGKTVKLSDFKGKTIVLEWLNHGCPFVRKHYDTNNMQTLQKKYTDKGVVWLSIISSAEGKQGYVDEAGALKDKESNKAFSTEILLDPKGIVGKAYEAKTTPHMFIIDENQTIVYQGAIDNKPDTEKESIKGAQNYLAAGLDEVLSKKKVSIANTKSYGCSVKY